MDRLATRLVTHSRMPMAVAIIMCADIFALLGALTLALLLRFDHLSVATIYRDFWLPHSASLPLAIVLYLGVFYSFHLYRYAWRFASIEMLWGVIAANSVGLCGMMALQKLVDGHMLPLTVLFIFWVMSIFLVGGMRIALRLANLGRSYGMDALNLLRRDTRPHRAVVLGGGADGARLLSALREDPNYTYDIIGVLDDNQQKHGIYIRGVRVLGPLKMLYDILAENSVDEVLIALPHASGAEIREYVMACRKKQVPVRIIPALHEVLSESQPMRLEEISVEDLLRRPTTCINLEQLGGYLTNKRIVVTGAGGTIGSEMCRQIMSLRPASLVLFGHGENSIHLIYQELVRKYPEYADRLHLAIGSVADDVRVGQIFHTYRPAVVFHAAAHKHVPIMEENVQEAVQNNVLGTRCIAEACGRYGVERMVLISTDKAVYPSSVMGATKWLCEEVARAMAGNYPGTRYVTVRFGNVLGSRGSVVPVFQEQIRHGGPVTVTHPEVTRYFMTIPEAVQLVLQAGAIGGTGELYLLDMGDPVKIVDLANDMIRLCGFEPGKDIQVICTGMRPGEKLHESLVTKEESLAPSSCKGFSTVQRPSYYQSSELMAVLRRLQQLASAGEANEVLDYLGEVIPTFASQRLLVDAVTADDTPPVIAHTTT